MSDSEFKVGQSVEAKWFPPPPEGSDGELSDDWISDDYNWFCAEITSVNNARDGYEYGLTWADGDQTCTNNRKPAHIRVMGSRKRKPNGKYTTKVSPGKRTSPRLGARAKKLKPSVGDPGDNQWNANTGTTARTWVRRFMGRT